MERTYTGYSLQQAYAWMIREMKAEDDPDLKTIKNTKRCLDLREFVDNPFDPEEYFDDFIERFQGSGIVLGYEMGGSKPGENANQIQTQVINTVVEGDKKWKTVYLAVYDQPFGDQVLKGSESETKKECVDKARLASAEEKRDLFVIIGKSPDGFVRCAAQVLYKPSPGQKIGTYQFFW